MLGILTALALAAGAFVIVSGLDDEDAAQVTLEPIDHTQENDFFGNLDLGLATETAEGTLTDLTTGLAGLPDFEGADQAVDASLAGSRAAGGEPGLYGGNREDGVCDIDQLTAFLTDPANADKAAAWTSVLGVDTGEIETYLDSLTPARLRVDTRVTNHGFEGGEATPFQSVLQAGTAVLVDESGVPRVKCNCGNPLAEPEGLGDTSESQALDIEAVAENPDMAWDDLDPSKVVTITPAEEALEELTIVDLETGGLLERPVGSRGEEDRGTGDLQVTLEWDGTADLDLHVTDPGGVEIWYSDTAPTGTDGELDVDANVGCSPSDPPGVENVFWPSGGAPPGTYTIEVDGFSVGGPDCTGGDYTVTVKVFGQEDQVFTGEVGDDETDTHTVTVG